MKKNSSSEFGFRSCDHPGGTGCCCFSLRLKSSFKDFRRPESHVALALGCRKVEGFTFFRWKNPPPIFVERWKEAPLKVEEFTPLGWRKAPPLKGSKRSLRWKKAPPIRLLTGCSAGLVLLECNHESDISKTIVKKGVERWKNPPPRGRCAKTKVEESTSPATKGGRKHLPLGATPKVEEFIDCASTIGMML